MKNNIVWIAIIILFNFNLISCSSPMSFSGSNPSAKGTPQSGQTMLWEGNSQAIWQKLQRNSTAKLTALLNSSNDLNQRAWIELALISKRYSNRNQALAQALLAWRTQNPSHSANSLLPGNDTLEKLANSTQPPQQIAILLPLQGDYASSGKVVREGILNAYYANLTHTGKQNVSFFDTTGKNITSLYQQAISEGADVVIGPLVKDDVQQLSRGGAFSSPVLALNYTNPFFGSLPKNFYEFGLLPEDEAIQVAERARENGLSNALVIVPDNAWGKRLVSTFSSKWHTLGGRTQDTLYYSDSTDLNQAIAGLLHINTEKDKRLTRGGSDKTILEQQRRQDFDVIFLFAQPKEASTIVPLLRYYYVNNIPIYATSSVYSGRPNPVKDVDLNGVTICDTPWSVQIARRKINDNQSDRLYAVGLDAYLLSQSIDRLVALPNFPIYGTTGALTLESSHQIHRRLPCNTIQNGTMR